MRSSHRWCYLICIFRGLLHACCLSYVEKSVLDRLLTYYDNKIRPTDQRNFFLSLDPSDAFPQPLIVNVSMKFHRVAFHDSMLTIDLELFETWFDDRLLIPQNSNKDQMRRQFLLPDPALVWHPYGCPVTNYEPSPPQRKVELSDSARLESTTRYIIQAHCDDDQSSVDSALSESFQCSILFEPEDIHDVNYFYNSLQQKNQSQSMTMEDFSCRFFIEPVGSSSNHKEVGENLLVKIFLTKSSTSYHLITSIAPSVLGVFLSWITLFSQRKMIRAMFQSTSFFTLIVLWGNDKQSSHATKLDIWILICLLFITTCVVESVLLACIPWPRSRIGIEEGSGSLTSINRLVIVNATENKRHKNGGRLVQIEQCSRRVRRYIDKDRLHIYFALSYPLVFIGVSLWYWLKAEV